MTTPADAGNTYTYFFTDSRATFHDGRQSSANRVDPRAIGLRPQGR